MRDPWSERGGKIPETTEVGACWQVAVPADEDLGDGRRRNRLNCVYSGATGAQTFHTMAQSQPDKPVGTAVMYSCDRALDFSGRVGLGR